MKIRTDVSRSYLAETVEEQQEAYDGWAAKYESDLCAMGYRIPAMIAAAFVRYVPADTASSTACSHVLSHDPTYCSAAGVRRAPPVATCSVGPW